MTYSQTLSALFDAYVAAGREARELENKWRESNPEFLAANRRFLWAWRKYKAEKDRQANKKEKL